MKFLYFILIVTVASNFINVPSGRFTFKFSIINEHNFYLKYGNLNFTLNQSGFVANNEKLKVIRLNNHTQKSNLWISVNLIEPKKLENNFIKFGHDYVVLNNTLCEFNPIDYEIVKSLRYVTSLEIESGLLKSKIEATSIIKDYSIKIFGQNRQFIDQSEIPITKQTLPDRLKTIYEIIKNRGPILDEDEIDAIKYSLDTPGCLIHSNKPIKINFKYESINFDSSPFLMKIWPKGSKSLVHDNSNFYGIYKVIDGDLLVEIYNHVNETVVIKSAHLSRDEIGWFSPDLYQTFKIINQNPIRPLITLHSYFGETVTLEESDFSYQNNEREEFASVYDYNEFKDIVLYEYYTRTCKRKLAECCEYSGLVCGWKLLLNSNCSNLFEKNGLYLCDAKENTVKFIDKCDNYCNQDRLATRCMSKLYAQTKFRNLGVLSFEQNPTYVKIWGKFENLTQNYKFKLKVYSGSNCEYKESIFKPSLIRDVQNIVLKSDNIGIINVDLKIYNIDFNIIDSNEYSILNRVLTLEDEHGTLVECAIILKIDKVEDPLIQTTTTSTTTSKNDLLFGKWIDYKTDRSYMSYGDGKEWTEYNGDVEFAKFRFIKFENADIIIYDEKRKIYVKLTDTTVMWGNGEANINWKFGTGSWQLKPQKNMM